MNMDKLEIYRVLVLSTAHLTFEDSQKLARIEKTEDPAETGMLVLETGYGWLIQVMQDYSAEQQEEFRREYGMSTAFTSLLDFAAQNDIQWLQFDQDGNAYEEFPQFNW